MKRFRDLIGPMSNLPYIAERYIVMPSENHIEIQRWCGYFCKIAPTWLENWIGSEMYSRRFKV